ncbi:MAG: lantibiotic dehydratase [Blastocatellia bacterium]
MKERVSIAGISMAAAGIETGRPARDCIELPNHLIALSEPGWAVWKWIGLRGTGFPISGLAKLACSESGLMADRLIQAERDAERTWEQSLAVLESEIGHCEEENRQALIKARRLLKAGRVPEAGASGRAQDAIKAFAAACQAVDNASGSYLASFEAAELKTSDAIREIASSSRFREAVTWQNHNALKTGLLPLLRRSDNGHRDSKTRRNEELVASYWQRYCAKNDTVGFFGPVGWARWQPSIEGIEVTPGADLLAERSVYLEGWCIDELAEILCQRGLKPWVPPRRNPTFYIKGAMACLPGKEPISLTESELFVLANCDGKRTAKDIASIMIERKALGIVSENEVFELLQNLHDRTLITWAPSIPLGLDAPSHLRRIVWSAEDEQIRPFAIAALDELDCKRAAIAQSAGDPDRLYDAFADLDTAFTNLTGARATRSEGKTYAGRVLAFEDCRRDVEVAIGSRILHDLDPALSLILTSARWMTHICAETFTEAFNQIYEQLVKETGSSVIECPAFWSRAQSRLLGSSAPVGSDLRRRLNTRWSEILSWPEGARSVQFESSELRPKVMQAFEAPGPGWNYAQYQSPDVMIAASSVDAIRRGEYQFVLGELHAAMNTLSTTLFVEHHPFPEDLFCAIDRDLPVPRVIIASSKYGHSSRDATALLSPKDYFLEFFDRTPSSPSQQCLPLGALVIDRIDGRVMVTTVDSAIRFDAIEAFEGYLTSQLIKNAFRLVEPDTHLPRITIDRLVVSRESWQFPAAEIEFAFETSEAHRFLNARRWAQANGLPRYLFFKSPIEVKPCFVDMDSPVLVNVFSRIVRRTAEGASVTNPSREGQMIKVSEMLPGPDEAWLPDAEGNLYACELRIVAVDLSRYPFTV